MADEKTYRPSRRTLSPEMDAWLRARGKNPNKVRQTIAKVPPTEKPAEKKEGA